MDEQDVKDNDNNQQEQSGNMYSYRNDNVNIKQSEAIRRSLGEGNPSGYPQNKFGSNPNNYNNDNDGSNSLNISQKSSESSSNTNLFFLPYIILASIQVAITLALSLLIEYDFEIRGLWISMLIFDLLYVCESGFKTIKYFPLILSYSSPNIYYVN